MEVGDTVYALGYPYSADAATTDENWNTNYAGSVESVTVTTGVVSRFVDYTRANARIIQHDAAINGGNSGGPLINEKGAVVIAVVVLRRKKPAAPPPSSAVKSPAEQEVRIQGQSGAFDGRRFVVNSQVRIGRAPNSNDLVYPQWNPRHQFPALCGHAVRRPGDAH